MGIIKLQDKGRVGNFLFQLATTLAISERCDCQYMLPEWQYKPYLNIKWHDDDGCDVDIVYKEPHFHFDNNVIRDDFINNNVVAINGYWQSEKYFEDQWDKIKSQFTFEKDFMDRILYHSGLEIKDNYWAVHIRLTDYIEKSDKYFHIEPEAYTAFFASHPECVFYIFSDDYRYCRNMYGELDNVEFVEKCSPIEHLALMSQFKNILIANSSFSWWAAKIAEIYNPNVNVFRPDHHFVGEFAKLNDSKDFYPERWHVFNTSMKVDLRDVTFMIPVSMDSKERKNNVDLVVCMLQRNFDTNIIIGEQGGERFSYMSRWTCYHNFKNMHSFHRTKMLNEMAIMSDTPIVVNYDADVIIPPAQIWKAVDKIRKDKADFVYPYRFYARVPRIPHRKEIMKVFDVGVLSHCFFKGTTVHSKVSWGGSIVLNKKKFIGAGMENENFVSWGREDFSRIVRFEKLGFRVERIYGLLYHINHVRGDNSTKLHADYRRNDAEYKKIKEMSKEELINYVESWPWRKDAINR